MEFDSVEGYHIENVVEEIDEDGKASPVASDKDPSVILVHYESMLGHTIEYIPPRVKIEISCLSMNEPTEDRLISSYIEQTFPGEDAAASCAYSNIPREGIPAMRGISETDSSSCPNV